MSVETREVDFDDKEPTAKFGSTPRIQVGGDAQGGLLREPSSSLLELIESYAHFEKLCDDAISQQDELTRMISRNMRCIDSDAEASLSTLDWGIAEAAPRQPFAEVRSRGALLNKVTPTALPLARKQWLLSGNVDLAPIEQLESEIKIIQFHLRRLETDILAKEPRSAKEAIQKLRFLTALMLTGDELEIDFFAYLVEECTDVIEAGTQDHSRRNH